MEFVKHNTTDFCPHHIVTNLSFMLRTFYGEVANLLRICLGNWCNGIWPLPYLHVVDLLPICCGETDVMDFGPNWN